MTPEEAISAFRARWTHPPLDIADVLERVALRGRWDGFVAVACPPVVRLFRRIETGVPELAQHTSCYVHSVRGVDPAIDLLESRARVAEENHRLRVRPSRTGTG